MKFVFLSSFLFLSTVSCRSVSDENDSDGAVSQEIQCQYNGVTYYEGDEMATRGKCFECTCHKGFVEPNAEACATIECPQRLDVGCEPVYSEGECCPVSWNCDSEGVDESSVPHTIAVLPNQCQCDWRYFKHYDAKGCKPVYKEDCDCPIRFECPDISNTVEDSKVCTYKGKTYEVGESIETSNPCEICACRSSYISIGVAISCIPVECPSAFGIRPKEGCYDVYAEDRCCSVDERCDSAEESNVTRPVCEYDGKTFQIGQKIYPEEDPCLICLCTENWTGIHGNSCHIHDCMLERKMEDLKQGCIPIYHEKTCCPIEFHCGTGEEPLNNKTLLLNAGVDHADSNDTCVFEGKHYNIGDALDIKHPTNCVVCTCSTPPDITCIHRQCPRPPNDDYENCKSLYHPDQCCPTYSCLQLAAPIVCDPVKCEEDCKVMMVPNGCPICMCGQVLCSPPKCQPGCEIEKNVASGTCPGCICPKDIKLIRPVCAPVKCGPQCHEATSPQGCPMCICGPLCSPPKCDPGCQVQTDVPEGQCPGCMCPDDASQDSLGKNIQCAPVKCGPMCREATGQFGCPMCLCDPMCSPPKCDPGCHAESNPSLGPCPGCVCDGVETKSNIQCAPVKCEEGCKEMSAPGGCPVCMCGTILCSPPKCQPGCEVEKDVAPGTCPGCTCPKDIRLIRPVCAPVKCGPQCHEATSPQGCPMCICGPLCSPPKCDPGCQVQTDTVEGQCPGCVCPTDASAHIEERNVQCAPVKCPAMCREAVGQYGCATCLCDPMCSPPKCDPGCHVESVPSSGPCPGCVCDDEKKVSDVQCAPVKCGPMCREATGQFGCPMCLCDPMCSPPKCDPGCVVESVPSSGPCPGCVCGGKTARMLECATLKCELPCRRMRLSPTICPTCICSPTPLCSMPKCDPGCKTEVVPPGRCPQCVCPDTKEQNVQCAPVKCGPMCREGTGQFGCPMCVCDPMCSPPKCDPGCHVESNPSLGPCPGCVCDNGDKTHDLQCAPVKCGPSCREVVGQFGCPTCLCGPLCSPPKCDPGCHVESNPTLGPCPACVC